MSLVRLPDGNCVNPGDVTCVELQQWASGAHTLVWVWKGGLLKTESFSFQGDCRDSLTRIINQVPPCTICLGSGKQASERQAIEGEAGDVCWSCGGSGDAKDQPQVVEGEAPPSDLMTGKQQPR